MHKCIRNMCIVYASVYVHRGFYKRLEIYMLARNITNSNPNSIIRIYTLYIDILCTHIIYKYIYIHICVYNIPMYNNIYIFVLYSW